MIASRAPPPWYSSLAKPRVFSGIQPSGNLHIGNYLGVDAATGSEEQEQYENIFCIVDMHAITVPQDPADAARRTRANWPRPCLAAGISLEPRALSSASRTSARTPSMAWMLNCLTPMGWLRADDPVQGQSRRRAQAVSAGLFDYPVLMAADILLYDADFVPVGDDQRQHIELTRDIAEQFNSTLRPEFVVPEPPTSRGSARASWAWTTRPRRSSKSDNPLEPRHPAWPTTPTPPAARSCAPSPTRGRDVRFDAARPLACYNLLTIYQIFSGQAAAGDRGPLRRARATAR